MILLLLFGSKLGFSWYWIHFTVRFGGVYAFGYNTAESELIGLKSGYKTWCLHELELSVNQLNSYHRRFLSFTLSV